MRELFHGHAQLLVWLEKEPSIVKAWLFGSRAKKSNHEDSDLDIAILLEPKDGQVLAEWILNATDSIGEIEHKRLLGIWYTLIFNLLAPIMTISFGLRCGITAS